MGRMIRMPGRVIAGIVGAVLLLGAPGATAESTAEAMKTFGLIGAWSPDCAADPGRGARLLFSSPAVGTPVMTEQSPGGGGAVPVSIQFEIRAATRVTEDK